jgi:hypothetical protein
MKSRMADAARARSRPAGLAFAEKISDGDSVKPVRP